MLHSCWFFLHCICTILCFHPSVDFLNMASDSLTPELIESQKAKLNEEIENVGLAEAFLRIISAQRLWGWLFSMCEYVTAWYFTFYLCISHMQTKILWRTIDFIRNIVFAGDTRTRWIITYKAVVQRCLAVSVSANPTFSISSLSLAFWDSNNSCDRESAAILEKSTLTLSRWLRSFIFYGWLKWHYISSIWPTVSMNCSCHALLLCL